MHYIFPIVEGHGEVTAVPEIIRRISFEREYPISCSVLTPYRLPRGKITQFGDVLDNVIRFGEAKIRSADGIGGVLVIIDSDDDCPLSLYSRFVSFKNKRTFLVPVSFVSPKMEYEAWFISCAEHMRTHKTVRDDAESHPNPENVRDAKGYFNREILIDSVNYSETVDQVKYSSILDINCVYNKCRSFRKICKEIDEILSL